MRFGRQVATAVLGTSLVFGGVATGVASLAPAASAQEVGTAAIGAGDTATVNANLLNIRQTPSLSGNILTTLGFGAQVSVVTGPVLSDGFTWFRVQQGGVFIGWAATAFLTETTSTPAPNPGTPGGQFAYGTTVTVSTDALNVRSLPAITASVLTVYTSGRTATITGGPTVAGGITWYAVDNTGWVAGQFLTAGSGPAPNPGTPTGKFTTGNTVVVNAATVNVRSGAGLNFATIDTAAFGERFTITQGPVVANGYEWYSVSGLVGAWIAGDFLSISSGSGTPGGTPGGSTGGFAFGQTVTVASGPLNVRALPTTSASILAVYNSGRTATITSDPRVADGITWYAVDNYGWVAGQYLRG